MRVCLCILFWSSPSDVAEKQTTETTMGDRMRDAERQAAQHATALPATTSSQMRGTSSLQRVFTEESAEMSRNRTEIHAAIDSLATTDDPIDRQEAFESARKKFAMYGKQNAHVDHYTADTRRRALEFRNKQSLKRQATQGKPTGKTAIATFPSRHRHDTKASEDSDDGDSALPLQNTLLLQENGELAAQLDEIEYHLDGILRRSNDVIDVDRGYTMAKSVVALTQLLKQPQVQTVMKIASHSHELYARIHAVLETLDTIQHNALKVAIAVLAFTLTTTVDADEFFDGGVVKTIVKCLEKASRGVQESSDGSNPVEKKEECLSTPSSDSKTPLKKSFLKRKKASSAEVQAVGEKKESQGASKAHGRRDRELHSELRELLRGFDAFAVGQQIQLSLQDVFCNTLHNLLQVGGSDEAVSGPASNHQVRRYYQHQQDTAGSTFEAILIRKKLVLESGGLTVLVELLRRRYDQVQDELTGALLRTPVRYEVATGLQRLRTMFRVLDQLSFLAQEVQVKMSTHESFFEIALSLIKALAQLAWSEASKLKWEMDGEFMHLVVDVLLAALRVLINLSHRNEHADKTIAKHHGTKTLLTAFCLLWSTTDRLQESSSGGEDKVAYDAMLLILSAITNCIEFSADNREQLSKIDVSVLPNCGSTQSTSVCSLLVAFFQSRIISYEHLLNDSNSQSDVDSDSWNPEDVILGGCTSLLLGCLMKESPANRASILSALPDGSPNLLLRALSAFVALHSQIGALTPEVGQSVLAVETLLKSQLGDLSAAEETKTDGNQTGAQASGRLGYPGSRSGEVTITMRMVRGGATRTMEVDEVSESGARSSMVPTMQSPQRVVSSVQSSPAAVVTTKRFTRVCSNVDDSDDALSEPENQRPVAKQVMVTPPRARRPVSTDKDKTPTPARVSATSLLTPPRRLFYGEEPSSAQSRITTPTPPRRVSSTVQSPFSTPSRSPGLLRIKRARQLVSDLEAELSKISSAASSHDSSTAMDATTSTDDADFSLALDDDKTRTPLRKKTRTTPSTASAERKKRFESPPTTQKQKTKTTPSKVGSLSARLNGVFDFDG